MPAETEVPASADGEQHPVFSQSAHPELWPFGPYRIIFNEPGAQFVSYGCLAAPSIELAIFTGQPQAFQTNRRYIDSDAPSLLKRLYAYTVSKERWQQYSYSTGVPQEEYPFETIVCAPKTPAIRLASLDTIRQLEKKADAPAVIARYLKSRLVPLRVTTTTIRSSGSTDDHTFESTFHALHDTISSAAPKATGWYANNLSFFRKDGNEQTFAPEKMLKTYTLRARAVARLLGDEFRSIVLRDMTDVEAILDEFRQNVARQKADTSQFKPKPSEILPRAWYLAITERGYESLNDRGDPRHNRLHWSAVILDYFVNLHEVYARLKERHIATSIPTIGPLIAAKKLMHMSRSLEAIETPVLKPEPVDITINPDRAVIFIGSNNSGKSFTMEMIAANAQESMMGRKTFARKFESPEFDAIIAIPAELPQETGKSTYTGQLGLLVKAIAEIQAIRAVKPDARIMLLTDELYAGTDENDSAALYRATIEWLSANGVTLIGATNNELVFAPEIAEFISMVDRKPITVLKPEDIVAKRQGISVLVTAGAPSEVVQRASALCGIDELPPPPSESRTPAEFTDLRNAQTLGLLEVTYRNDIGVGKNLILWDFLPVRPILFNKPKSLERIFGTDPDDPIKQHIRSWFDDIPTDLRPQLGEQLRVIPEIISIYMSLENDFKNDRDRPPENIRDRNIALIEGALVYRERLTLAIRALESAPESLRSPLHPAILAISDAIDHLASITTNEANYDNLQRQIVRAVSPFWERGIPYLPHVDTVSAFFHLDQLFRVHKFCRVTKTDDTSVTATGLFHTGLTYTFLGKDTVVTKNDVAFTGAHPGILLGANASGKTTLAESLGVAAFFALNFGYAPAKTFALGAGIKKTAALTDYLRDPARPKDSGKWLSRQTQIAAILAAAKDGGYLVVLDEPGEGTNGFEGRATLIALAEYLHAHGNTVVFTTHQHKAIDILDKTTGITAYASGLGGGGRYSFAQGRASSLGLNIAVEEGLLTEIVDRARENLVLLAQENHTNKI